ncbi:hypothetical protein H6G76_15895 [Nostoc sp. FACHB-152]|uniref:hypothetical protein n=1 Tax=unclassified Nostoc TaxID=2593658 RepID=UPI00168619E3|nr:MULTISPECIES: hypothetical protein [unclassified Nostoc]MBD2448608.1 hypothetical protein [Nostoc sp. FACHB-152]MBD2469924.1 hypothetical protein [Nostoc sp. FACHB-145]
MNFLFLKNKNNRLIFLFAIGLLTSLISPLNAQTSSLRLNDASYSLSCRNEKIVQGNRLEALCLNATGTVGSTSSIQLRGIENINGYLVQTPIINTSDFYQSCIGITIFNGTLSASCRTNNSSVFYRRSSIKLKEITNINGRLVYEVDKIYEVTANNIVNHAYNNHGSEFGNNISRSQFKVIVLNIMRNYSQRKKVRSGRVAFWSQRYQAVAIIQPVDRLGSSTAFKPTRGFAYYTGIQ